MSQRKYQAHPADEEMLMHIRRYLIGFRVTNGWTHIELSNRVNNTTHAAYRLEKGDFDWTLVRLQRWPEPFGLKLEASPVFEGRMPNSSEMLGEAIDAEPEIQAIEEMLRVSEGSSRHMWQRMYLTTYLRLAREVQKISFKELGERLGLTGDAVRAWEVSSDNVRLLRLLNHARALGGRIELRIR